MALPSAVRAMLDPSIYPHVVASVSLLQTQISFIFLTGTYVYKIKKPVDLGYLDYTTLAKREYFCHQELKLNSRLSSSVYLEVVPIVRQNNHISLGGTGEVVEHAVKMRQLPSDRMMDVLLSRNHVSQEMVERLAMKLAGFHQRAQTNAEIASYGSLNAILANTEENFDQTLAYVGVSLSPEQYRNIRAYTDSFAGQNHELFEERKKAGKTRDCHGDLHSAHVCFVEDICIFDCIEFNDRFRYCDVASEIAFLAMDLDYHHHPLLSSQFVDAYVSAAQDKDLPRLVNFYKCYRAYVRGKVGSFKLADPLVPQEEKTGVLAAARRYFELAHLYARI